MNTQSPTELLEQQQTEVLQQIHKAESSSAHPKEEAPKPEQLVQPLTPEEWAAESEGLVQPLTPEEWAAESEHLVQPLTREERAAELERSETDPSAQD